VSSQVDFLTFQKLWLTDNSVKSVFTKDFNLGTRIGKATLGPFVQSSKSYVWDKIVFIAPVVWGLLFIGKIRQKV
jgi:hypothetical protein